MARAFIVRSSSSESMAERPRLRPPSRALSTRTSNQDSMLLVRNCTDTVYTSAPGTSDTSANMMSTRKVRRDPNTLARRWRTSTVSW